MQPAIVLSSGAVFDFRAPEVCPWTIDDIARGLAYTARFRGQTSAFYSVAQHSVIMSRQAHEDIALAALFHDAAEAFVGDMPTPLKAMFPDFRHLEAEIQASILRRLGLPPDIPAAVKGLDRRMLATEVRDLVRKDHDAYCWPLPQDTEPFPLDVIPVPPKRAHWEFHKRAAELLGMDRYRAINRDSRRRRGAAETAR